jgi:hypothetical protein
MRSMIWFHRDGALGGGGGGGGGAGGGGGGGGAGGCVGDILGVPRLGGVPPPPPPPPVPFLPEGPRCDFAKSMMGYTGYIWFLPPRTYPTGYFRSGGLEPQFVLVRGITSLSVITITPPNLFPS